jgi:hypothetical protein
VQNPPCTAIKIKSKKKKLDCVRWWVQEQAHAEFHACRIPDANLLAAHANLLHTGELRQKNSVVVNDSNGLILVHLHDAVIN